MKRMFLFLFMFVLVLQGQVFAEESVDTIEITVFHAGSLTGPYQKAAKAFEELHPNIKIHLEGSSSQEAIRKITNLGRPCDILASADYEMINALMKPEWADFNILFARNKIVLAFIKAVTQIKLHRKTGMIFCASRKYSTDIPILISTLVVTGLFY